jgi:spore germination cell wall hydrolase CwlJ-like protein
MRQCIAVIVAACLLISSCSVQNVKPEPYVSVVDKVDTHIDFVIKTDPVVFPTINVISANDMNCLAKTIYYEAGSEPQKGKEAVGIVITNRVRTHKFADSICGVVRQSTVLGGKRFCQFSWYCTGGEAKLNATIDNEQYRQCLTVARSILNGEVDNRLDNAVSFHLVGVNAGWTRMIKVTQIGNHIFYREKA